ncbi:MAG: DUF192 domain-containing protein [Schleiferiaceae bacterium]|nr:DUF192 domain-containing protein [Schleiferiaceae bacterium]
MKKSLFKTVGTILLSLALIGFLYVQIAPAITGVDTKVKSHAQNIAETYEPPFLLEGYGAFVNGSDTVATYRIELAESEREVQQGMMWRKHMDPDMGMLFLMPEERMQSFWMKNTYVGLDIVYISSAGQVVSIQANAQPFSETPLPSEGPAQVILELPAGTCAQVGITPGMNFKWNRL